MVGALGSLSSSGSTGALRGAAPCRSPAYRRTHPRECNKGYPGSGWPKCGDLCAWTDYRKAMPGQCGGGAVGDLATLLGGCAASGGLERRNPIPAGRYWIDVIGTTNIRDLMNGLMTAQKMGVVVIENSEFAGTEMSVDLIFEKLAGGGDPQVWVLFRVTGFGTISLDNTRFGYPTIAPECVKGKNDTSQKPPEPKAEIPMWAYLAGGVLGLMALSKIVGDVTSIMPSKRD